MTETRVRRAAWVVLAFGILALLLRGADQPADPAFALEPRMPLAGFEETKFVVETPNGKVLDWCALLAATEAARGQGLSGQTSLRGYDAMLFRFDQPSTNSFWMFRTLLPLSIAFVDEQGAFVSSADMEPCRSEDPAACPVYPAAKPYRLAIETGQGDLGRLGLVEGSKVRVGGECA